MASDATILIPDISGFTDFVTNTEITHGSHAISILLDNIIQNVGDEYVISEIEGDAILMFRKGEVPTKKEILDTCKKIFNAFHTLKKWMQQHNICLCNTCQELSDLTLKFIVHRGLVGEMKIGRFVTLSGRDVIQAHRLMKNSIPSSEYLLITEKLCQQLPDRNEDFGLEWLSLSDDYPTLGKINYQFANLGFANSPVPDVQIKNENYKDAAKPFLETAISADFKDAYMKLIDIPNRSEWVPGLISIEQDMPLVFAGSTHYCSFENFTATVSPLNLSISENLIRYTETLNSEEDKISLVYEFLFSKVEEGKCNLSSRFFSVDSSMLTVDHEKMLLTQLKEMNEGLKSFYTSSAN